MRRLVLLFLILPLFRAQEKNSGDFLESTTAAACIDDDCSDNELLDKIDKAENKIGPPKIKVKEKGTVLSDADKTSPSSLPLENPRDSEEEQEFLREVASPQQDEHKTWSDYDRYWRQYYASSYGSNPSPGYSYSQPHYYYDSSRSPYNYYSNPFYPHSTYPPQYNSQPLQSSYGPQPYHYNTQPSPYFQNYYPQYSQNYPQSNQGLGLQSGLNVGLGNGMGFGISSGIGFNMGR